LAEALLLASITLLPNKVVTMADAEATATRIRSFWVSEIFICRPSIRNSLTRYKWVLDVLDALDPAI
jgi:hypothetical protein